MFGMTLSLRTYAEIFGSIAIVLGFLWFVHHERDIGRQEIMAKDAQVVALTNQLNAQKDADAQAIVDAATAVFNNMSHQPVPPARIVRLCSQPLSGGATGSNGGAAAKPDDSAGLQVTVERPGSEVGFDIRPITEHILDTASAEVKALQAYIGACQKEGFCRATVPDAAPARTQVPSLDSQ